MFFTSFFAVVFLAGAFVDLSIDITLKYLIWHIISNSFIIKKIRRFLYGNSTICTFYYNTWHNLF